MTSRARSLLCGLTACAAVGLAGSDEINAAFGDARTISFYNIHTKETLSVLYKQNGQYIPAAMDKLNYILRDWRKNQTIKMDPAVIDLAWEMHSELGSKEPIHIICGYRSGATNEMLRRTVGGQASQSQHIGGKAIDLTFPDISLKQLRYSALIREKGGVGYYPTSGVPFVHVDTSRVRAWPRLPRYELALLFPNGHSQHQPAEGGNISKDDVRVAQSRHKDLAVQIAAYFDIRNQAKTGAPVPNVAVASAETATKPQLVAPPRQAHPALAPAAPMPKLAKEPRAVEPKAQIEPKVAVAAKPAAPLQVAAAEPKLAAEPRRVTKPAATLASMGPSLPSGAGLSSLIAREMAKPLPPAAATPATLASASPEDRRQWPSGWARAPEFDDEHPDELSYRPFPIAPLLSENINFDHPQLARLIHPDVAKTYDLVGDETREYPMRFRPGLQLAQMLEANQFAGDAVAINRMLDGEANRNTGGILDRRVKTAN